MTSRLARFLLVVFAPVIVLSASGRRLSYRLQRAAGLASVAGVAAGLASLVLFLLLGQPSWSLILFFLAFGVHVVMGLAEVIVASRVLGGGAARLGGALFGALVGHGLWSAAFWLIFPVADSDATALIVFTVIVCSAILGACGAATGAALAGRHRSDEASV